ncbi:MAG: transpeptidase family protein [Thermoanaerobaculia bacterium]|nr:transpeptidase family protein [Thermoanaerobaculia bacterium]
MLVGFAGLWILAILVRLVELQVVRHDEYVKRAKRQQERTVELAPRRGTIVDREGRPLAVTTTVESVFAIPSDIDDPAGVARALAPIVKQPFRELKRKLSESEKEFVWVARRVDAETAATVKARALPGVRLLKESARRYPEGPLAAAVVGYVGTDSQGLGGLEYTWDREVRGRPARVTVLRDAAQRSYAIQRGAPGGAARATDEVEGASLRLTLHAGLQHVAERELAAVRAETNARSASAVVLDPATGEVLVMASVPTFDPNKWAESSADARRCRPIADAYEPGSTFKVITAAAAIEAGTIRPDDLVDCGGGSLTIGRTTIREHGRAAWAALPLVDVLAHSSNVGAAHIGLGMGKADFHRAIRAFGFGRKTGLDLDGENGGLLRDPSAWSALSLPTISFGQEIGVNALQLARAFGAIANGGVLPSPYLVADVSRPGLGSEARRPAPGARVLSEKTAASMRRLLVKVVEEGTGKKAAVPGFTVAGKTGTAQKAIPGAGYSSDRYVASFFGFLPAERPRLVVGVLVDEPRGRTYGGDVAAPVFAAIAGEAMRVLGEPGLPAEDRVTPTFLTADLSRGASAAASPLPPGLVPASIRPPALPEDLSRLAAGERLVPDVAGLSAREAVQQLAQRGFRPALTGHGFVVAQEPLPGTPTARGSVVRLTLSFDPPSNDASLGALAFGDSGEVPEP